MDQISFDNFLEILGRIDPDAPARVIANRKRKIPEQVDLGWLMQAFTWSATPEGAKYWVDLYSKMTAIELGGIEDEPEKKNYWLGLRRTAKG